MSVALSPDTRALIAALFAAKRHPVLVQALEERVAEGLPGCAGATPESLERLRFAVLKTLREGVYDLEGAVELARIDWRDLLMAAGFGHDTEAHRSWAADVLDRTGA